MNAAGYFNSAHMALPSNIDEWKGAMPAVLERVPEEVRAEVREYLASLYQRTKVIRRESAKPGSLASRRVGK